MNDAERFLLDFHKEFPGCTRVAFASGKTSDTGQSSYELLSSRACGEVLDLGCGDGHLLSLLPTDCRATGIDISPDELREAADRAPAAQLVHGRAQSLPFSSNRFDTVISHFAFHLMTDLEAVVAEIARVLKPGGNFFAVVGGGPKVGDPFELFLDIMLAQRRDEEKIPRIGERRGRTEEGLSKLFASVPQFASPLSVHHTYVDFGGTFEQVWQRVRTIYDLMPMGAEQLATLKEAFREGLGRREAHIPCTMAIRLIHGVAS